MGYINIFLKKRKANIKNVIHPALLTIKNYADIAEKMNCTEQHIADIFSGRVELHGLWERDALCTACGVEAVEVLLVRTSEQVKHDLLPLKLLPVEWKQIIIQMFNELTKNKKRKVTENISSDSGK